MKINNLPTATSINDGDTFVIVQDGKTKKISKEALEIADDILIEDGYLYLVINGQKIGVGTALPELNTDNQMSNTSTNPVQNKVVKAYVDGVDFRLTENISSKFDVSVNLYNEATNIVGRYPSSAGVWLTDAQFNTTDFIYVKKGTYTMTYDTTNKRLFEYMAKYNLNQEFAGRTTLASGSIEIEEDCYIRLIGRPLRIENTNIMLVKGTELPTEYVPYFLKLKSEYLPEIEADTDDLIISKEDTDFVKASGNLINHMTITSGKIISTAGVLTDNVQYCITDKMRLKRSTVYTACKLTRISYFKKDGTHIVTKSIENASYTPITFTTLAEFDYAVISLPKNIVVKDEWQLYEGDTVPEKFEKQHLVIDGYRIYDEPDVEVDPIAEFREKDRIVFDKSPLFTLDEEIDGIDETQKNSVSIFAMYDTLMSENPLYITKTELGADSQGKKIYRYDFKNPDMYSGSLGTGSSKKPKMIIVSGIHGNEYTGIFCLFNALKQITNNPKLQHIKNNVHFIIVPIMNVYGVDNNTRKNENGINMARNFEVGFIDSTPVSDLGYGGTVALSENGCRYVNNIMKENSDAILFTSCHNFASAVDADPKCFLWAYCETKYFNNLSEKIIVKLSQEWGKKYDNLPTKEGYVVNSDINRYIGYKEMAPLLGTEANQALKYGIQAGVFEICDRFWFESDTPETETSFVISRGTETHINIILTHLYNYDANF